MNGGNECNGYKYIYISCNVEECRYFLNKYFKDTQCKLANTINSSIWKSGIPSSAKLNTSKINSLR